MLLSKLHAGEDSGQVITLGAVWGSVGGVEPLGDVVGVDGVIGMSAANTNNGCKTSERISATPTEKIAFSGIPRILINKYQEEES